jgi:hypothetical protein
MVGIKGLNIDTRLRHPSRQLSELPGLSLVESLNNHIPLSRDRNAGCVKGATGGRPVGDEQVSNALTLDDPGSSPLDTDASAAKGLSHIGQGARTVFQNDCKVFHGVNK